MVEHDAGASSGHGTLKLFIGAAPGVGKTYTMLREAVALRDRGVDVVVGYVDTHDREETARQLDGLEVVPPLSIALGDRVFHEVNVEALVARHPDFAVIDELAHTNTPGSLFPKRYMDVEYVLDHGISVLTAVNVQHLEGIYREAIKITGVSVRELIPETFIKRAGEVAVIDVTPETLRQRLQDGLIYPVDKVPHALDHFFRMDNLAGLRELALRTVAGNVDARLEGSYARQRIPGPVGARDVILVALSHVDRARLLLERGRRMANRLSAELYAMTVTPGALDMMRPSERDAVEALEGLARDYGAQWVRDPAPEWPPGAGIMRAAERLKVTQIVVGQPRTRHAPWRRALSPGPVLYLLGHMTYQDVRIVGWTSTEPTGPDGRTRPPVDTRRFDGRLTIYVGAAPGVGKTYRMLQDANAARERGVDVVIGFVETHGRRETRRQIGYLPVIPSGRIRFGAHTYEELDTEAIVARHPQVVLVDELAHSNVPGSTRQKRYQDILYLLEQGIDVVTAVNIQHLESLHDKVEHITGVQVRERVPDSFMKRAEELKLIDVTPETLQLRLMDGLIYSPDKVEKALANFFQTANLAALRELALLEVADNVELRRRDVEEPRPTERILVGVNHRPYTERLLRRGWRMADRLQGELWALLVKTDLKLTTEEEQRLSAVQQLAEQLGARVLTRSAPVEEVGATIVTVARELGVTQLVVGQPMPVRSVRDRWRPNPVAHILDHADFVDLHVVADARHVVGNS